MFYALFSRHGLLKKFMFGALFFTASFCVHAQVVNSITLDLGSLDGTETTPYKSPAANQKVETIYLANTFPKRAYIVGIDVTYRVLPPLSMADIDSIQKRDGAPICPELQKKYTDVYKWIANADSTASEKELKAKLAELATLKSKTRCNDQKLLNAIADLFDSCTRPYPLPVPLQMRSSNDYAITITSGTRTFKYLFTGKDRGQWMLNYGFVFSSKALEPSRYYTKQLGADSFQILKKRPANVVDLRFAPAVFFSWFPNEKLSRDWNKSLSLGIGFNMQSPVVSLGYNLMYNQNIGFSAGVAFYEQQKLLGQYSENQIVKMNIEDAQLHEGSFFRPNIFFALNVRLGQNPFQQHQ